MAARAVILFLVVIGQSIFVGIKRVEGSAQSSASPPEYVCAPIRDHDPGMCLARVEWGSSLGSRTPVILVHGWNSKDIPGDPDLAAWEGLISHLEKNRWFRDNYKLYNLIYLSNVQSVRGLGLAFGSLIDQMDRADPDFAYKPMVIVGYSMGGLIARSYMQDPRLSSSGLGGDRVARLITLGTPHHGTPIANGPARDHKAGGLASLLLRLDGGFFNKDLTWSTDNRFDLHWDNYDKLLDYDRYPNEQNSFLERLNGNDAFKSKIIAYAGTVKPFTQIDDCYLSLFHDSGCLAGMMKNALGVSESDGVVPLASALYYPCDDCLGVRVFPGYDHSEIVRGELHDWLPFPVSGENDPLFFDIAANLLSLVMPRYAQSDSYADLGSPEDERFHNLGGWSNINPGPLPRPDTDRTSRYQTLRGQSSVDLFIAEVGAPYRLTFRSEAGQCDDSFEAYLNGYLVHKYVHNKKPDFPIHSMDIPAKFFASSNVRVVFKNLAKDNCGSAAIYYVRLDRI